jgi:glycine oxidase
MSKSTDVVIVGGGVIGCAIAYFLRKMGIGVTVLERGEIGAQASNAAAGLLAPLGPLSGPGPLADLLLGSFALFPALVTELEDASGILVEYKQTGALRIVRDAKRVASLRKRMEEWQPLGLQMYWLSGDEAREREPLLAPDVCAAIYAPEESQVRAPLLVKAFAQAASRLGAVFYSHSEIKGLQRHGTRVSGVYTSEGEMLACDHLVIAAGAWAARCGDWLGFELPISPLRGQILSLRQAGLPTLPLRHIVFGEATYLAPKEDGTIVVGATKEEVGFDARITVDGVVWLLETARKLAPMLGQSSVEALWAGLRPKTPDGQPILGAAPNWENVTLATGHNSVGVLLSAITGQCIAELVATGRTPGIIAPFVQTRFTDLTQG